ncbi:MAG TPA: tRNA 5-methoxyuridine(34)/uridine 5-oxyacetic acid(34) synthase CmoB [Xanthomonadales bacterium]|nr:tRNA 5-methoxyuridine(34)/uridine 5-oxyacetic acid(34) synthase CmoB [Xanthomonadales bacterium]
MPLTSPFADLCGQAFAALDEQAVGNDWLQALCKNATHVTQQNTHGDSPLWTEALRRLPPAISCLDARRAAPILGHPVADRERLQEILLSFHPWRKGPLEVAGVLIDSEWRSDWKWERVRPHVDLRNQFVLDIGCGNGYFGWRMLAEGARLVVGIDPMLVFFMQWLACRHFAGDAPNFVLPLGVEDLPAGPAGIDTIFSMGVLYHRRDPLEHLRRIRKLLKPGGMLVLETLVLPGESGGPVLVPASRYARMRNVWAVPTTGQLLQWVDRAGFQAAVLTDVSATTTEEQRSTQWMRFESLAQALDPSDAGRTLEGYPAPTRAIVIAHT